MSKDRTSPDLKAFEKKVTEVDGHRLWAARTTADGYPAFTWGGKSYPAHRWFWIRNVGDIPPDQCLIQSCGNKLCVSLDHLSLSAQGVFEKTAFDRTEQVEKSALLEKDSKDEILELRAKGVSQIAIADHFGVTPKAVRDIEFAEESEKS